MAATIEIYTWSRCPFCIRAKALLKQKGCHFTEYCIDGDNDAREQMTQRAGGSSTLPQIFIDDQHIGGCDDLYDLESRKHLDFLLQK